MKSIYAKQTGAVKVGPYLITLVALALVLGGLYWWRQLNVGEPQAWPQQAVPVTAMQLSAQVLAENQTAMGSLSAVQEVVLAPEVAGRVTAINFTSGDKVAAKDVLVQLYDETEKANLSAASAAAKLADAQLQRTEKLAPIGAESKELLTQRQAESERAQATVEQAQAQLRLKQITAPFAGQLGIRRINMGQYLNPGDTVVSLTNLDKLYVDFTVPQQHLAKLSLGAPVTLTVDAFPDRLFSATITTIEPQIEAATRNVIVQATMDNPDGLLRPSMYVSVSVKVAETPDALMIPVTAVLTSAQGNSVVVVRGNTPTEQGQAEFVAVTLGQRVGEQVEVLSGLNANDVVVTAGQNRIQPGAPLTVEITGKESR
ncbi:efflux RND transporter periplasmic adaptor subunit [Alteromonas sp. ZYF713]|nr:efflux RND transporter periplasmic adaptor subunit [Alteromonas sp. ZYF713]